MLISYLCCLQMTFQLLSTLASLVPIVDCSEASQHRSDLTEVRGVGTQQLYDRCILAVDVRIAVIRVVIKDVHVE